MPTVLLVRHGRSTANADKILAGRLPGIALDERGRQQAEAVRDRLGDLPLAQVVSSPMLRCQQTAQALRPDARVETEERLTECDYGSWSGRKLADLAAEDLWRTVQSQPSQARFPEGESLREMSERAIGAVRDRDAQIRDTDGSDAVWVAVSHGDVIKAILADAYGMHLDLFQRIVVDPASVSIIRYTAQSPQVLAVNLTGREFASLLPTDAGQTAGETAGETAGDAVVGGRDA